MAVCLTPRIAFCIKAKNFKFGLIWPEHLPPTLATSHAETQHSQMRSFWPEGKMQCVAENKYYTSPWTHRPHHETWCWWQHHAVGMLFFSRDREAGRSWWEDGWSQIQGRKLVSLKKTWNRGGGSHFRRTTALNIQPDLLWVGLKQSSHVLEWPSQSRSVDCILLLDVLNRTNQSFVLILSLKFFLVKLFILK